MNFIRVALDVPNASLFEYRADAATRDDIGQRVLVPLGRKLVVGVIMEVSRTSSLPPQRIRAAVAILHDVPPLPAELLELLVFCADYYHHPLGEVVMNALPSRLRRRTPPGVTVRRYRLTPAGEAVDPRSLQRAPVRRAVLETLKTARAALDRATVRSIVPKAAGALRAMVAQGWVEHVELPCPADAAVAPHPVSRDPGPILNSDQRAAIARICAAPSHFAPWLLAGITGSGKTEVYLHAIADALARDRQALVLVPEINLTPQLEAIFRARFPGTRIVPLHSALSETERFHNWRAAQCGAARVVLGTRLAVFTPLPDLGLIVVDEEHETSFKQAEGLRYSARDVAVMRAKRCRIPVILGSATPSLESFHRSRTGGYGLISLPHRANATLSSISCIDTRKETLTDGLTPSLLAAIRTAIERREQTLVFINRRGYAPVLICPACLWASCCPRCSAKLVLHLKAQCMRCHHCGREEAIPSACPACGNQDLAPLGHGTQRVEAALARFFPSARVLRIDRDSTRGRGSWDEMRRQITAMEVDILVGTQLLAKGHDFPQLNLVGVLNADGSLYSTDFRAGERLFSRLTQVAGRAGRGSRPGRVLIQTQFPAHPLYRALQTHDYTAFAQELLVERKQAGLPPFVHQALVRAESPRLDTTLEFLEQAAREGAKHASGVTIYDPVAASITRLAGVERAQLTVQSRSRSSLHAFLHAWRPHLARNGRKVRWAIDVDPLEI